MFERGCTEASAKYFIYTKQSWLINKPTNDILFVPIAFTSPSTFGWLLLLTYILATNVANYTIVYVANFNSDSIRDLFFFRIG
jgi:hypothetical protein